MKRLLLLPLFLAACQGGERAETDSHVDMAMVLLREGQIQQALEQLERSPLAQDTQSTPTWLAPLVASLLSRRELTLADSLLQRYPIEGPAAGDLRFQQATLHELRGELREADAMYEQLESDPAQALDARVKRATIALLENRASDARRHAEAVVAENQFHHRARTMLAQALLMEGDPAEAYEQILRTPAGPQRMLIEGEALLRSGRPAEALSPLYELLKQRPEDPRPRMLLGEALLEMGQLDDARPHLEALAGIEHPFEESQMLLARLWREKGNDARADSLDQAYRRERRWREAMAIRGEGLRHSAAGDLEEALRWFERAREILPQDPELQNDLGAILARLERYEEAEVAFREALEGNPDNIAAHRNLVNLYNILGRDEERDAEMKVYLRLVAESDERSP